MSVIWLIFFVLGFSFNIYVLREVVKEAKKDPTAAGLAVYFGGLALVACGMCGFGIILFILERVA